MQTSRHADASDTRLTWRLLASAGHLLVLMATLLLTAMPWMEHYWNFDRFLLGGQDFELTLFSMITFLCLVLLLTYLGKQWVSVILSLRIWLWSVFEKSELITQVSVSHVLRSVMGEPDPDQGFDSCESLLRI